MLDYKRIAAMPECGGARGWFLFLVTLAWLALVPGVGFLDGKLVTVKKYVL